MMIMVVNYFGGLKLEAWVWWSGRSKAAVADATAPEQVLCRELTRRSGLSACSRGSRFLWSSAIKLTVHHTNHNFEVLVKKLSNPTLLRMNVDIRQRVKVARIYLKTRTRSHKRTTNNVINACFRRRMRQGTSSPRSTYLPAHYLWVGIKSSSSSPEWCSLSFSSVWSSSAEGMSVFDKFRWHWRENKMIKD